MCTIVLIRGVVPGLPLVVAANRDEVLARETRPAHLLAEGPRVLGGLDVEHHGTWMGVNEHGLLVGLTNQRTFTGRDKSKRTRGEIVLTALRADTFAAADAYVRGLDPGVYNPFNLVIGDATQARCYYGRDDWSVEDVPLGIHVLPNDTLDSAYFPKVAWALERVAAALGVPIRPWPEARAALFEALADHDTPEDIHLPPGFDPMLVRKLHALCVHTPLYGTRSAMVAALAPGRAADVWFADGPPCTTAPVDVTLILGVPLAGAG